MSSQTEVGSYSSPEPEVVLSLLRQQVVLYGKLEALTQEQRSLISLDDTRPLLRLLADRQKLTAELTTIGGKLRPAREHWDSCCERFTTGQREEAERLLGDTRGSLKRLLDQDEEDARLLSVKKQTTASALESVHTTAQAISAYGAPRRSGDPGGGFHEET